MPEITILRWPRKTEMSTFLETVFSDGAFLVERARLLQWLVFFPFFVRLQTSSCSFSQKLFRAFAKADDTEGSLLSIFFRHCATFFSICLPSKGPTFKFFDILQQTKVPKSPKGLPFCVFLHYETVQTSHFYFFFEN